MIIGMRELTRRWIGDDLDEDMVDVREMVLGRPPGAGVKDADHIGMIIAMERES